MIVELTDKEVELLQGLLNLGVGVLDWTQLDAYHKASIEQVFARLKEKLA